MIKIILVGTVIMASACAQKDKPEFPKPNGTPINDFANLIAHEDSVVIDSLIKRIYDDKLAEIVVCTMDSIPKASVGHSDALRYGTELFNSWGIGRKDVNDGILFFISKYDKKTALCTGLGIETYLPDSTCGRILDNYLIPHFKRGNVGKGFIAGVMITQKILQQRKKSAAF